MTFDVRLVAYRPNGERLGVVRHTTRVSAAMPMNDVSSLRLDVPVDLAGAAYLDEPCEIAVEVSRGGDWIEPANARFLRLQWERNPAQAVPTMRVTAPGYAWLLGTAGIEGPDKPYFDGDSENGNPNRRFVNATAGTVLVTAIQEAKALGMLPGLEIDFSASRDSAGKTWDKVLPEISYTPGLPIADILSNLTSQGLTDWEVQGRTLRVFNADGAMGVDRTTGNGIVGLRLGRDVSDAPTRGDLSQLVHRAVVRGEGGQVWAMESDATLAPWGKFQRVSNQGTVSQEATATWLMDSALRQGSGELVEMTRELRFETAQFLPVFDYEVGDFIFAPDDTGSRERVRVRQLTLDKAANGRVTGNVVLNDRFMEAALRQARRVQGIQGGSTIGGGSGAIPADRAEDKRTPRAPAALGADSTAFIADSGEARAIVHLSWSAVNAATDGSAMDIAHYEVWVRDPKRSASFSGPWNVEGTTYDHGPVDTGVELDFQVRAVAYRTHRRSSPVQVTVRTEVDTTPPPAPSAPVLSSRLGTVTVRWDGLTHLGTPMPLDFDRVEVWIGGNPDAPLADLGAPPLYYSPVGCTDPVEFRISGFRYAPEATNTSTDVLAYLHADGALIGAVTFNGDLISVMFIDGDTTYSYSLEMSPYQDPDWHHLLNPQDAVIYVTGTYVEVQIGQRTERVNTPEGVSLAGLDQVALATPEGDLRWPFTNAQIWAPGQPVATLRESSGQNLTVLTDQPYNEPVTVWFTAVDRSGNQSEPSQQRQITVQSVRDPDLVDTTLTDQINEVATGPVDGARVIPGTLRVDALTVGIGNRIVDPGFTNAELRSQRANSLVTWSEWSDQPGASHSAIVSTGGWGMGLGGPTGTYDGLIDVEPGDKIYMAINARWYAGAGTFRFAYAARLTDGSEDVRYTPGGQTYTTGQSSDWYEEVWTVPDDVVAIQMRVQVTGADSRVRFQRPYWQVQSAAVLIQDGAITAPKIETNAIGAREANINELWADSAWIGLARTRVLIANIVEAEQIAADAITSKHTLTGPTIQTLAQANRGIKIVNNAFRAYDGNGNTRCLISGSTGMITATGELNTGTVGLRVRIAPDANADGEPGIRLYSGGSGARDAALFITGTTPPGGWAAYDTVLAGSETTRNSSGRADLVLHHGGDFSLYQQWGTNAYHGIVKSGRHVNVRGRHQGTVSANIAQTLVASSGPYSMTSGAWFGSFVYGAPVPVGTRIVVAGGRSLVVNVENGRGAVATTTNATASGFTAGLYSTDGGAMTGMYVNWIATWV